MTHYQEKTLGAYSELSGLANFQLAAKHLPLKKTNKALSHLSGPFKTRVRGRGMEFEDVRLYQPGDDVRNIDWRVTARTGNAYTKQFREEREKPVFVVVDQRKNMFFGSEKSMKSVLANDLAAYLLWAAFHKGDRVGGLVFNDHEHTEIRPRRQRKTVLTFLHHMVKYNHQLSSHPDTINFPLSSILLEIKRLARPGTQIFFISDCHDLDETCSALLHDISRHSEMTVLFTYDKLEQELPPGGIYQASNGQQKILFDSSNKKSRKAYHDDFETHLDACKKLLGKYQVPLIPVSTSDSALKVLQFYFGSRR